MLISESLSVFSGLVTIFSAVVREGWVGSLVPIMGSEVTGGVG